VRRFLPFAELPEPPSAYWAANHVDRHRAPGLTARRERSGKLGRVTARDPDPYIEIFELLLSIDDELTRTLAATGSLPFPPFDREHAELIAEIKRELGRRSAAAAAVSA
jgi:hypothetical protein